MLLLFCTGALHGKFIQTNKASRCVCRPFCHHKAIHHYGQRICKHTITQGIWKNSGKRRLQAKEKGADAVLFLDLMILNDGSTLSGIATSDSIGKSSVTISRAPVSPVVTTRKEILFLKYDWRRLVKFESSLLRPGIFWWYLYPGHSLLLRSRNTGKNFIYEHSCQ